MNAKKIKLVNWCDRTMFYFPHYYCCVTTPELFEQELKRLVIPERDWPPCVGREGMNATVWELTDPRGEKCFIVTLAGWQGKDSIEVAGLIVHEATHVKQEVLKAMGEKNCGDEFEAYMMQNIAMNLMQCFVKQTQ